MDLLLVQPGAMSWPNLTLKQCKNYVKAQRNEKPAVYHTTSARIGCFFIPDNN